jgi:hypothetical protein
MGPAVSSLTHDKRLFIFFAGRRRISWNQAGFLFFSAPWSVMVRQRRDAARALPYLHVAAVDVLPGGGNRILIVFALEIEAAKDVSVHAEQIGPVVCHPVPPQRQTVARGAYRRINK